MDHILVVYLGTLCPTQDHRDFFPCFLLEGVAILPAFWKSVAYSSDSAIRSYIYHLQNSV